MKRLLRVLTPAIVCSGLALWSACDSATPTAPSGTVLTISASPSQIGLNGTSQIVVIGRRPDGNPLNKGTEIFFTTDLGNLNPAFATVDEDGVARATLRGDGRAGTAMVQARVSTSTGGGDMGGGTGSATVSVQIGVDPETKPTLLLSVSPNTVDVQETADVTVIARNSDGTPVTAGQTVILTTTLGTLSPTRPRTDSDGIARSTFNAGDRGGTATITAILGTSDPATSQVAVQDAPTSLTLGANRVSIPNTGGDIEVTAVVTNAQGEGVNQRSVQFTTSHGAFDGGSSVLTNSQGIATATVTVTQDDIDSGDTIIITATTPPGGEDLSDAVSVDVQ